MPKPVDVPHIRRAVNSGLFTLMLLVVAFMLLAPKSEIVAGASAALNKNSSNPGATSSPTCQPDWNIVSSPNAGNGDNSLKSVAALSPNDAWAVGQYRDAGLNHTLIQRWNGSQWSTVPSPNGESHSFLKGVTAISTGDAWSVGYYVTSTSSLPLVEHWNGTLWSQVQVPISDTYVNELAAVTSVSANDVWAVGYYFNEYVRATPLTMHWNGTQWSIIEAPTPDPTYNFYLTSVTAIAASDVWAVGYGAQSSSYETLIMHWNGVNWTIVSSPNPEFGGNNYLLSVSGSGPNDVWAVGYADDGRTRVVILKWDGTQWLTQTGANPDQEFNQLNGVTAVSANEAWAVGYYGAGQQSLIERWDGTTWSRYPSANIPLNYNVLNAVAADNAGNLWAVGEYSGENPSRTLTMRYPGSGCAYVTPTVTPTATAVFNCGLGWRPVSHPEPDITNLYDIDVIGPNNIWAVGSILADTPQGTHPNTLTEHWDGTQWTIVASANQYPFGNILLGVSALSSSDIWAVGYGVNNIGGLGALMLHWNGIQWVLAGTLRGGSGTGTVLRDVKAVAANDVWAVGEDNTITVEAVILHWNGGNWDYIGIPGHGKMGDSLYGVGVVAANNVWAVGKTHGRDTLIIHWNGTEWSVVPSANISNHSHILADIVTISANNIWAVGEHRLPGFPYQTLIEHWNGSTWSIVPSPNASTGDNLLNGVAALSPNDIWAVGYSVNGEQYTTLIEHWNGSQWSIVPGPALPGNNTLSNIDIVSAGEVWAVGGIIGSTIERYSDNGIVCPTATSTSIATATATRTATRTATPAPTACNITFTDVPTGSTFFSFVRCLACLGILNGYDCGGTGEPCNPANDPYFRPNNNVTRGQIAKIVSNAANFNDPVSGQTFQDVPPGSTFHLFIERLVAHSVISGYDCGGPGEPCVAPGNLPYFRPNGNATRGQLAKIVCRAYGCTGTVNGQTFQDVLPTNTFYTDIEHLYALGAIGGYECGNPEPCMPPLNRPYFRPGNNVTRGQTAKIVSNAFFPGCSPTIRR